MTRTAVALPHSLPRPMKLTRDRRGGVPPPAHVRVTGAELPRRERDAIARKLARQLGKFSGAIERVTVRLSDVNGPKGGHDQLVRVKVVLSGLPSVLVEGRDALRYRAVSRAITAAGLAVSRRVRRRVTAPRRRLVAPLAPAP